MPAIAAILSDDDAPEFVNPFLTERREFVIPAVNLAALRDKIDKLNRRAKRLGCAPIGLSIGPARTVEKEQHVRSAEGSAHDHTRKLRVACHDVVVTGERPKLPGGWQLAGRVQLLDGVSLLHTVPGETVPREMHDAHNRCDHCNVNRTRNDVYVIRNADSRFMVVGSTCIADFLGGIGPNQMAWYAESLAALDCRAYEDFDGFRSGGYATDFDVERYLTAAACAIRLIGWIARSAVKFSGGSATSDYAREIYSGKLRITASGDYTTAETSRFGSVNSVVESTEADSAEALAAIAWAQAINLETANDYLINVHKVADLSFAPWNLSGIAASIVSAYQRELGRLATRNRERVVSQHVGTVDKRQEFTLTVKRISSWEGRYGTTHLHVMTDEIGNVLTWRASRESLSEGATYRLAGTVKRHGDYKGTLQTELSRCTVKAKISGDE